MRPHLDGPGAREHLLQAVEHLAHEVVRSLPHEVLGRGRGEGVGGAQLPSTTPDGPGPVTSRTLRGWARSHGPRWRTPRWAETRPCVRTACCPVATCYRTAAGRTWSLGPAHLGEVVDLPESLLDLQAAPVAGDPVHYGHHRLLDHLAADETLQHLGYLHTLFGVLPAEHLHLLEQGSVSGRGPAHPEASHPEVPSLPADLTTARSDTSPRNPA